MLRQARLASPDEGIPLSEITPFYQNVSFSFRDARALFCDPPASFAIARDLSRFFRTRTPAIDD